MSGPADDVGYVPPFQKKYFSYDMMSKYEPLGEAIAKVEKSEGTDEEAFKAFEEHWAKFMDFSWCSQWDGKKYDILFYGMSGYTGYLMMEYLKRSVLKNKKESFQLRFRWSVGGQGGGDAGPAVRRHGVGRHTNPHCQLR